jgi:hypothetical protein
LNRNRTAAYLRCVGWLEVYGMMVLVKVGPTQCVCMCVCVCVCVCVYLSVIRYISKSLTHKRVGRRGQRKSMCFNGFKD